MKKTLRGLTLTAVMLSASAPTFGDENDYFDVEDSVKPVAFVGDLPNDAEDAYFASDADDASVQKKASSAEAKAVSQASHNVAQRRQAAYPVQPVAQRYTPAPAMGPMHQAPARQPAAYAQQHYSPISANQMQPLQTVSWCDSPGCSSPGCTGCDSTPMYGGGGCGSMGCDGGCSSMGGSCGGGGCSLGGGGGCSITKGLGLTTSGGWFRHEALLWFVEARDIIPLVTVSPAGTEPEIGLPGTQTVFGDEIEGDLSIGYRGDVGINVSDNIGIGGRFWIMEDNGDSFSLGGDGSAFSIGRPFYDDLANAENSVLIGSVIPGALFNGNVDISSEVSLLAAEAYARLTFTSNKNCRLDLIGGYSHFQLDDTLRMTSSSTDTTSTRTLNDLFETENRFHGGQIGFETIINRGRWFARSLTKVHLGNMVQAVRIQGNSVQNFSPAPPILTGGGLFAQGNQGTFENEEFSFIPELNFKLGYNFREHVAMTVGYSFLYFDKASTVGDVIDRTVNTGGLFTNTFGNRPEFVPGASGLWVQGVDLGIAITF